MRLINPSVEILDTNGYDINGIYKDIERASRVCYKSENNITEDSAKKMVDSLIKRGHTSCLEHGTIYLRIPLHIASKYIQDKYSIVKNIYEASYLNPYKYDGFVTTNYRVLVENEWLDDLKYLCEPTEYHEKRISVRFICSRSISHELVRHRVMSFCQESQRYCNYSKDKHGNEITYIIPSWFPSWFEEGKYYREDQNPFLTVGGDPQVYGYDDSANLWYENGMEIKRGYENWEDIEHMCEVWQKAEITYLDLVRTLNPQQAREILPNATKTEIIVTGFSSDWEHFFSLRCDKAAHPDIRALAIPLQEEFIKRGYIQ